MFSTHSVCVENIVYVLIYFCCVLNDFHENKKTT